MNYKKIFLSAFFIQFTLSYCNNDSETRILELNATLAMRIYTLSEFGKAIETQEELIETMTKKMSKFIVEATKSLNDRQKKQFTEQFFDFEERFNRALVNCDVRNLIVNELFSDKTPNAEYVERIKSLIMRKFIELTKLKQLIGAYEIYLQDTLKIQFELQQLKINSICNTNKLISE
jgi:uncharacterized coiled-coil protein SlyX